VLPRGLQTALSSALATLSLGCAALAQGPLTTQAESVTLRGAQPMSLGDAQVIALKQNREVLEASLEVNRSSALLKAVKTLRYPKILGIAFWGQQLNSNYGQNVAVIPGVFQPVTQQYRLGMEVEAANLGVGIARQRLRLAQQRSVAEVKNLYLSILALQSSLSSLEKNFEFLKELQRYVQAEVKRGAALPVDALLVQARVARADFEVDKVKVDLSTKGQTLNRLLGRSLREECVLVDEPVAPATEINEDEQIFQAVAQRPELSELRLNVHRSHLQGKIQVAGYIPDVSFGVTGIFSHNLDTTLPRTFAAVGFLGVWEPWDWGRRIQLSKEANSRMREDTVKLSDMTDSVSIAVDKARRDVRLADKEANAGNLEQESAKEQLRVVHRRFLVGAALLKDVMQAESDYIKAISENVKAKTDMAAARVELDEALGRDF
jgi:outer membrane protein TolC